MFETGQQPVEELPRLFHVFFAFQFQLNGRAQISWLSALVKLTIRSGIFMKTAPTACSFHRDRHLLLFFAMLTFGSRIIMAVTFCMLFTFGGNLFLAQQLISIPLKYSPAPPPRRRTRGTAIIMIFLSLPPPSSIGSTSPSLASVVSLFFLRCSLKSSVLLLKF